MLVFCLVHGLHGVWCLFQGSWYVLYLMLVCRGGGLYMCVQVCDCLCITGWFRLTLSIRLDRKVVTKTACKC